MNWINAFRFDVSIRWFPPKRNQVQWTTERRFQIEMGPFWSLIHPECSNLKILYSIRIKSRDNIFSFNLLSTFCMCSSVSFSINWRATIIIKPKHIDVTFKLMLLIGFAYIDVFVFYYDIYSLFVNAMSIWEFCWCIGGNRALGLLLSTMFIPVAQYLHVECEFVASLWLKQIKLSSIDISMVNVCIVYGLWHFSLLVRFSLIG